MERRRGPADGASVAPKCIPASSTRIARPNSALPYAITRQYIRTEEQFPIAQCFTAALEFLETNRSSDNWLLQVECFDPHDPSSPPSATASKPITRALLDWPRYGRADYLLAEAAELRANYHALLSMCDAHLDRLLAWLDAADAWKDTAIILSTDHGLLRGEHEYWQEPPAFFNEVAHIPLLIHHPAAKPGRRRALTQTIDLMPSILDLFEAPIPPEVRGHSLLPLLTDDQPLRFRPLFGQFGGATNITDGRFVWLVYPPSDQPDPLFHYTLMPMHMRSCLRTRRDGCRDAPSALRFHPRHARPSGPDHQRSSRQHAAPLSAARRAHRAFRPRHRSGQTSPATAPAEEARLRTS